MNTLLSLHNQTMHLQRWPVDQRNRDLQAWDSADEYLINTIYEQGLCNENSRILIINDSFGALSCFLAAYQPFTQTDSYISQLGSKANLALNDLTDDPQRHLTSLDAIPSDINLVLLKIPKNNGYLSQTLAQLSQTLQPGTTIIAGAKTTDIHSSTLKYFEQYIGATTTSLAKKKSRLIFTRLSQPPQAYPYPKTWSLAEQNLTLVNHANVFSKESLDIGARIFMQFIPKQLDGQKIIDLGCGNGVIGLSILENSDPAEVCFIDESFMAVDAARLSVTATLAAQNKAERLNICRFSVDDCLSAQSTASADVILCNPPFHQQQAVTDHIAWQMFNDARRVLKPGGRLIIVGNRNLAYHIKLKRIFGNCHTLGGDRKFTVLAATN